MHNLFLVKGMWLSIEVLGQLIQLKISLNILKGKTEVTYGLLIPSEGLYWAPHYCYSVKSGFL